MKRRAVLLSTFCGLLAAVAAVRVPTCRERALIGRRPGARPSAVGATRRPLAGVRVRASETPPEAEWIILFFSPTYRTAGISGSPAGLLGSQGERPGCHRRRGTPVHRAAGHPAPADWATLPSTATSRVFRRGRRARRRSTRRAPLVARRVAERRDRIVVIYAVSAAARSAVPARRWGSRAASLLGSPKGLY